MHLEPPVNIRELVNTGEIIGALDILSRLTGYKIRVMAPGNPAEKAFTLGENLFEFDIHGYWTARVAFQPIEGKNPLNNFQDIVMLVRDILTRAYEIDDLAEAVQESCDQINNLVKIAIAGVIIPDIDGIIEIFLREVAELFKSNAAFVAVSTSPTRPYTVRRLVVSGDVEKVSITNADTNALRKLCYDLEKEGEEFRLWRGDSLPPILSHLLGNPQKDLFTAPLKISNQSLGCIGASASIGNTAMQQWLTIYMGLAAGAIAGAVWRRMEMEAEKTAIKAREEVATRVIHLMRNHLFAMKGNLKWVREISDEKLSNLEELGSALGKLEKNLHDASEIISEFRKYTAINQLELELADINFLLRPIVEEMRKAYDENLVFKEQYAPELPKIKLYVVLFRTVIDELIVNASQHLQGKGQIQIRTAIASDYEKKLMNLPVDRDFLAIEFADNGPGVSDENKEKIFQIGFSMRTMGMGIGLALVKKYVEQHQGKIAEVGKEGEGATFLILLPASEG